MLLIINYVMGTPHMMSPSHQMPPIITGIMAAPCWKFEKLQIMPLEFGYIESSEKSDKKYTNTTHIGL